MAIKTQNIAQQAFTLVELLVVIAIMGILLSALVLGINKVLSSGNVFNAAGQISQALDQSRTYAMANNCYVVIGITEVSAATPVNFTQAQVSGTGTVLIEIVATKDGSNNVTTTTAAGSVPNFISISKPLIFNNLHLADLNGVAQTNGMARPTFDYNLSYYYANAAIATPVGVLWPYGSFTGIFLQFDSQGTATYLNAAFPNTGPMTPAAIVPLMELGLQASHSTVITSTATDLNYAALQIAGISGANHLYRP